jgi:GT2 family glycosyltransferase
MPYSVIIPSRLKSNLLPCLAAIRQQQPDARVIVVDDGLELTDEEKKPLDCIWLRGVKPFIYARNCNIGMRYQDVSELRYKTEPRDVILMNDDALLMSPRGFDAMARQATENPEYGVIGAVTNLVGNPNQRPRISGLREDPWMVCFICVYIPRRTIETVGMLDEIFTDYGWEDSDYCLRVRNAGLKIGISDDCFVDHSSLQSTFRGSPQRSGDIRHNGQLFAEKWATV